MKELATHLGYWYGLSIDSKEIAILAITLSYQHSEALDSKLWYYWSGWGAA